VPQSPDRSPSYAFAADFSWRPRPVFTRGRKCCLARSARRGGERAACGRDKGWTGPAACWLPRAPAGRPCQPVTHYRTCYTDFSLQKKQCGCTCVALSSGGAPTDRHYRTPNLSQSSRFALSSRPAISCLHQVLTPENASQIDASDYDPKFWAPDSPPTSLQLTFDSPATLQACLQVLLLPHLAFKIVGNQR